jgi:hypothetical protein
MSCYSKAATHPITHRDAHCANGRSEVQSVTPCIATLAGRPRSLPPISQVSTYPTAAASLSSLRSWLARAKVRRNQVYMHRLLNGA